MNKIVKKLVEEIKYLKRQQLYNEREQDYAIGNENYLNTLQKEHDDMFIEIGKLITYLLEEYSLDEINDMIKE